MKKIVRSILKIILVVVGAGLSAAVAVVLLVFAALLLLGGFFSKPIPSDDELIRNFMAHEAAFEEIRTLALKIEDGHYYPPFDRGFGDENDRRCDKWFSDDERTRLDSLLDAVGCERIYYRSREYYRGEAADSALTLTYWARGLSIGGTWKEYRYRPGWQMSSCGGEPEFYTGVETGDIMKESGSADTVVYKPIKGDWYVEFGHDN